MCTTIPTNLKSENFATFRGGEGRGVKMVLWLTLLFRCYCHVKSSAHCVCLTTASLGEERVTSHYQIMWCGKPSSVQRLLWMYQIFITQEQIHTHILSLIPGSTNQPGNETNVVLYIDSCFKAVPHFPYPVFGATQWGQWQWSKIELLNMKCTWPYANTVAL